MKNVNRMESFLEKVISLLHGISSLVLLLVALLITSDVIGRSLLGQPIKGAFELTEFGSAIMIFFALAITHRSKEHISIGFLVDKLPVRAKHFTEALIELFVFLVILVMAMSIFTEGLYIMSKNIVTTDLQMPLYPYIFIISIGALVFALTALLEMIKHIVKAVSSS